MGSIMRALNSKETKRLHQQLAEQWGYEEKIPYAFFLNEKKEKVSLFSKDIADLDISKLRVDTMGLYFGAWVKGQFRLTIEGSQLIGSKCTKNIITITKEEMQQWLQGESFIVEELATPPCAEVGQFVLVRFENDFIGCGKYAGEKILNYIPKTRYIHALYD